MEQNNAQGFFRIEDICRMPPANKQTNEPVFPFSRTHWLEGIAMGVYPEPVKVGQLSLWPKRVIHDLAERVARNEIKFPPCDQRRKIIQERRKAKLAA